MRAAFCTLFAIITAVDAAHTLLLRSILHSRRPLSTVAGRVFNSMKNARVRPKKALKFEVGLSDSESASFDADYPLDKSVAAASDHEERSEEELLAIGKRVRQYLNQTIDDKELARAVLSKSGKSRTTSRKMPKVSLTASYGGIGISKSIKIPEMAPAAQPESGTVATEEESIANASEEAAEETPERTTAMQVFEGSLRSSMETVQTAVVQQLQHRMIDVVKKLSVLFVVWCTRSGVDLTSATSALFRQALHKYNAVMYATVKEVMRSAATTIASIAVSEAIKHFGPSIGISAA